MAKRDSKVKVGGLTASTYYCGIEYTVTGALVAIDDDAARKHFLHERQPKRPTFNGVADDVNAFWEIECTAYLAREGLIAATAGESWGAKRAVGIDDAIVRLVNIGGAFAFATTAYVCPNPLDGSDTWAGALHFGATRIAEAVHSFIKMNNWLLPTLEEVVQRRLMSVDEIVARAAGEVV